MLPSSDMGLMGLTERSNNSKIYTKVISNNDSILRTSGSGGVQI